MTQITIRDATPEDISTIEDIAVAKSDVAFHLAPTTTSTAKINGAQFGLSLKF